jgi:hypothetical protein
MPLLALAKFPFFAWSFKLLLHVYSSFSLQKFNNGTKGKFHFSNFKFQYSHIQIQTFQFFQIPNASHRDFKFQILIFSFVFTHPNLDILILKISNSKHFIYKFQILIFSFVFTHPNLDILILKISNSKHFIYKFQILVFSFQYSHIEIQTF